ncbi:MAG: hypothetical protein Q8868_02595 [Bacteroidota bacterium]|nr:hypothetical protein [Bacteroidota bacterium]
MSHSASYRMILSRMGYYDYQRGLIFHHLSEQESWKNHMDNCRRFIIKAMDMYKPAVVTVLGSGWLLDIPLKEIAELAEEVNLIDIIHPPEVRSQVAGMKNVIIREEDVSGGVITAVWEKARGRIFFNKLKSLGEINFSEYNPGFEPGLVISINILTQLESLPVRFLKGRSNAGEGDFLNLRQELQQKHISFLKKHKSVLITDVSEVITRSSGVTEEAASVLVDLPEGRYRESWTWQFDSTSSDYYNKKSVFRVSAIII